MASGKQTPRQKMINMMYLILTAMLALNVSKDILKALTELNSSLNQTVQTVESKNADIYGNFVSAAEENPQKAGKWKDMAFDVREKSDDIHKYIAGMKDKLIKITGGKENGVPKALDNRSKPTNYMINQKNATELRKKIESFRAAMIEKAGDDEKLKQTIRKKFSTAKIKQGDKKISWEKAKFQNYPLAAVLPFLTNIQAKVRNTESDVISRLQSNIGKSDLKFTDVRVVVDDKSSYVTKGEEYKAEVFLAAYDRTQTPEITIDGKKLPEEKIQNGKGIVTFPGNTVGQQTWDGEITINQIGKEPKTYPIPKTTYKVAPRSVVISPTKMNVLYRGVDNPLEIGVPGVDPSKVKVSGPGVSGSNGNYTANVTNVSGKQMTINVSVVEKKDGEKVTRPAGSKKFRIKGLPPAIGNIYGKTEGLFSKGAISKAKVEASYKDFPFDMPLKVTSFEVAIPDFPPEKVQGNTMPQKVRQRIESLAPGATVSIRNIKARGPNGVRVPRIGNISVDVN